MLDIRYIRENTDQVEAALQRRNAGFSVKELVLVDEQYRTVNSEWESLNRRRNEISELFKTAKVEASQKAELQAETKKIKERYETLGKEKDELENKVSQMLLAIPNMPESSVPDGVDENDNAEQHRWGEIPAIADPKPHYELGTELNVFDFERGVKISESRFTVLMTNGARLERAIMNYMLDSHGKRGYQEVFPPVMVNRDCMIGTGQ